MTKFSVVALQIRIIKAIADELRKRPSFETNDCLYTKVLYDSDSGGNSSLIEIRDVLGTLFEENPM